MVFFQTCSKTNSARLPVVDTSQCWRMVSCNFNTFPNLSRITGRYLFS